MGRRFESIRVAAVERLAAGRGFGGDKDMQGSSRFSVIELILAEYCGRLSLC